MDISRRDRPPFVSNERGDRRFGISQVGRERRVAMAQDMWSHVGGQSAKLRYPRPKLRKTGHATVATRSWKHKLAGLGQSVQHVTGGSREWSHRFAGLRSLRVTVRRARSISDHFNERASPRRNPVSAIKRAAATAAGQSVFFASRKAWPKLAYSFSASRRSRFLSAKSVTPLTGLSGRTSFRTA